MSNHEADEFAPHWSAILKDGTLAVTFEIETTLTVLPDAGLIDLLRAAIVAQRGALVPLRMIVNGVEHRAEFPTNAPVRTVIAKALTDNKYPGRDAEEWELRDAEGRHIEHGLTLGAALANYPNSDPLWLSRRPGVGA